MRIFNAYAAPTVWGPEVEVASHLGVVSYSIQFEATGDTLVLGRVRYFGGENGGVEKVEEFTGSVDIRTANAVATVRVQFRGIPLGSTVIVTITP